MPETPAGESGGAPPPAAVDRIAQLKPPGKLDFDSASLWSSWKRWKEEVELYMDLAMARKDVKTKIKLFLYLIGSRGREMYETLSFTHEPDDRNLSHFLEGFEAHCNPKQNETMERYKLFQCFQEPGESFERFVTDLKVLASTCNFGTLKDSLVCDRIICGIQDKQLREDLLKESDLNLEKCLRTCCAAALSKDQSKTLEPDQGEVHLVKDNQKRHPKRPPEQSFKDDKDHMSVADRVPDANHRKKPKLKEFVTCKFYGNKHEKRLDKCLAFGKRCLSCKKMNHFTAQCRLNTKVNVVDTDEDEDHKYCLTLESGNRKHAEKIFATLNVDKSAIKFQLDSGVTWNLLPVIEKVTEPTPWVSSLVTARKPNGQLRVCLDPKDLNEALKRSYYSTPTIDEILPELGRAKVFSTINAKNEFWHVELTDESSMLTTFNSPFGRF